MIKNGAAVRVEMVDLGTLMDAKDVDMSGITAKVDENRCVAKEPDDVSCQNPFAGQRGVDFGPICTVPIPTPRTNGGDEPS